MDYSDKAVALSRKRHKVEGLNFQQGDAESLPFADSSFDVVVNVESSHCYGSMEAFLREVRRVLKPGGHFLYADLRYRAELGCWREQLRGSGLQIVRETNITPNVLAALDADHDRKIALMQKILPKRLIGAFGDFAAVRGSVVHEEFRTGGMQYFHFVLRKD